MTSNDILEGCIDQLNESNHTFNFHALDMQLLHTYMYVTMTSNDILEGCINQLNESNHTFNFHALDMQLCIIYTYMYIHVHNNDIN